MVFFPEGPPPASFLFPPRVRVGKSARRSDRSIRSLSRSAEVSPTRRAITQLSRERRQSLWFCGCFLARPRGLVRRRGVWKLPRLSAHSSFSSSSLGVRASESRSVFLPASPRSLTPTAHARATRRVLFRPLLLLRSSRRARRVRSSRGCFRGDHRVRGPGGDCRRDPGGSAGAGLGLPQLAPETAPRPALGLPAGRDDVTEFKVPRRDVGRLQGHKAENLRSIGARRTRFVSSPTTSRTRTGARR